MNIKCFLLEVSGERNMYFRRYASATTEEKNCPIGLGYHNAEVFFDTIPDTERYIHDYDHSDSRWPTTCKCGYIFKEEDEWQIFNSHVYIRKDTGERYDQQNFPVGATWRVTWYEDMEGCRGLDGQCWGVQTPGGLWVIDQRASNCTRPEDNVHKCWCRHGEAPNFTVDKNGNTCSAGGGSIVIRQYHGFLINGELTDC